MEIMELIDGSTDLKRLMSDEGAKDKYPPPTPFSILDEAEIPAVGDFVEVFWSGYTHDFERILYPHLCQIMAVNGRDITLNIPLDAELLGDWILPHVKRSRRTHVYCVWDYAIKFNDRVHKYGIRAWFYSGEGEDIVLLGSDEILDNED